MKNRIWSLLFSAAVVIGHAGGVMAGELTIDEIQGELDAATPEQPADFSGHDLSHLDLSGMDLSGVNLAGANLNNARMENTVLTGANLMGANLDGAWLIGADFSNANLRDVHMFGPVVARGLDPSREQSPVFKGADLSGARVIAKLSQGNDAEADFSKASLGADMGNQSMGLMRFEAEGADLTNANFSGASLNHALFKFANLTGADFRDADLRSAEFNGANLSNAKFAGADASGANFDSATLTGATGMDSAKGMVVDE
ncbi:pentapeptide repeat-containing protein [Salinisphaera aquimarina]|uniref:Pentapeptide repeat-containing protein n=1 Tax=Salinisphaera aquimarina TaxID=2094031 RepID=A0ABV7EU18_9GAMM